MSSATSVPAESAEVSPKVLRKAIAASAMGNATEWFDYGVYGATTSYIANQLAGGSIIITLLGFAVSFVLRPLGGFIWGPLGDRMGRRAVLSMTIILMSGATFLLAWIPTYNTIGAAAIVILIALRVIQGFSTGGEYGGAATFMAEYAPDRRRGFYGSFLEFGTLSGFVAGSALVLILQLALPADVMNSWGWRIPFMVALPLGLTGLYLRSRMEETPVFRELESAGESETKATTALADVLRNHWRTVLTLMGLVIALNVVNYTLLSYMPTYLKTEIHLSNNRALILPIIGMLVMMIFIPFAGALSDRVGRKPVWLISMAGLLVLAIPAYKLMAANFALAIVAFAVLGLLYILQLGTISATFPAMFPTNVRYAGFAIGYNVATALFGGTSSLVNEWMIRVTGDTLFPAYYMMGACAIGIVAWFFLTETAGASIKGRKVPRAARTATGKFIRPAGA